MGLEQLSGAQPSARGHFFARQAFFKCPQDFFSNIFYTNYLIKHNLLYIKVYIERDFFARLHFFDYIISPPSLFDLNFCPIEKKVGHRWSRVSTH
jgi:hypothetical protein